jgi:hypothetical protein
VRLFLLEEEMGDLHEWYYPQAEIWERTRKQYFAEVTGLPAVCPNH